MTDDIPAVWPVPLDAKPTILQIGVGVHGVRAPVERYKLSAWSLHLYRYDGEVLVNGRVLEIRPGNVGVTAPGAEMEYRYRGRSLHTYAHFTLPDLGGEGVTIPAMQALGEAFGRFGEDLDEAVVWFANGSRRAEVRLWDLLWRLAPRGGGNNAAEAVEGPAFPPAVGTRCRSSSGAWGSRSGSANWPGKPDCRTTI
jgi:hypothetical protein